MYENIKYEELKNLKDEQKIIALNELRERFGENKAIAKATGAATIAISNMVKKYILGEHVGRKKAENENNEVNQVINEPKQEDTKPEKRKYVRKAQQLEVINTQEPVSIVKSEEEVQYQANLEVDEELIIINDFVFTTGLKGTLEGEEVKTRITGIINSLLDDKKYLVELKISEI